MSRLQNVGSDREEDALKIRLEEKPVTFLWSDGQKRRMDGQRHETSNWWSDDRQTAKVRARKCGGYHQNQVTIVIKQNEALHETGHFISEKGGSWQKNSKEGMER